MSKHALFRSAVLAIFMLFYGIILHPDKPESYVNIRRIIFTYWKPELFILRHVGLAFPLGDHCSTDSLEICISSLAVSGHPMLALAQKQPSLCVSNQSESRVNTRRVILPSWKPKLLIFRLENLTFPLGDYCFTDSFEICISSLALPGDPVLALAQKQQSPFVSNLDKERNFGIRVFCYSKTPLSEEKPPFYVFVYPAYAYTNRTNSWLLTRIKRIKFPRSRVVSSTNGYASFNPVIVSMLLVCCGDIKTQPGLKSTSISAKCPACDRTVAKNHLSARCNECNKSWHIKCVGLTKKTIPSSYIYCGCALPNFSDSFFELDLELNDAGVSPSKGSDDDLSVRYKQYNYKNTRIAYLRATLPKILIFNFHPEIDFAHNSSTNFTWQVSNKYEIISEKSNFLKIF